MNWIALSSETPGVIRDPAGVPVEWTLLRAGDTPLCQEGRDGVLLSLGQPCPLENYEAGRNPLPYPGIEPDG